MEIAKGEGIKLGKKSIYPTLLIYPMNDITNHYKEIPYIAPIFVIEHNNKFQIYLDPRIQDNYQDKLTQSFDGDMIAQQNQFCTFKYYIKHDAPIENIKGEKFQFPKYKLEIVKVYNNKKG